ncbi:hypothetical protein C8R44DRAFT_737971 [Mycena epipterygia]|nr:hypothetical protein C8R44DRAFT_737971 [Mycena epipterygia]
MTSKMDRSGRPGIAKLQIQFYYKKRMRNSEDGWVIGNNPSTPRAKAVDFHRPAPANMHPQGVDSLNSSPGPLDGSLTIPQLLDRHLEHSPNHTAYIYDDPKGEIVSVIFSQYIRTVHAACCAPEGLANLLTQTKTAAVYISPDSRSKSVLSEALAIGGAQVPVFDAPTFERLQGELDALSEPLPPLLSATLDSTALILHSSGKLHYSPPSLHFSILEADFHGVGISLRTWPVSMGLIIAVFRPTTPPILPTPENALNALIVTKPDLVLSTPASIETWSDDPLGLKMMQSIKCLTYGGAPLNKRVGAALVSKGVVLSSTYVPEEDGSPLYTHTYLVSPSYATCYTNAEVDGKPGCSVRDLLEQHPENPELYRVYGRKDDLIVFSSAAKMNPGPVVTDFIEAHVNRNPLVDGAVVFGEGKTRPGVIIQLKSEFQSNLLDEGKRSKVLDALWASVDESNRNSPTHFQIPRELVVLADPQKPFALTSKLQPRRRVIFEDYREEIRAAYLSL